MVYDEAAFPPARVRDAVMAGEEDSLDCASLLMQRVEVSRG